MVTDLSMFWKVNSCVKTYAASWSLFTVVYKKFKLFVFFQCCRNMKYSRYQDSFFVHSWFDSLFILFVVEESVAYGRIHNLSLSWQRFWKLMHEGLTDLIYCLSGPFPQVRLVIYYRFFCLVWFLYDFRRYYFLSLTVLRMLSCRLRKKEVTIKFSWKSCFEVRSSSFRHLTCLTTTTTKNENGAGIKKNKTTTTKKTVNSQRS